MGNSETWQDIYKNSSFGNRYPSSYLVSLFHNRIKHMLGPKNAEDTNILDFGCSFGANSMMFNRLGYNTYGIDVSVEAIDEAKRLNGGVNRDRFLCVNLLDEKCAPIKSLFGVEFDLIIASECMYYFTNTERHSLIGKFKESMTMDGLIYVSTQTYDMPMYESLKSEPKDADGMVMVKTTGSIQQQLKVNLPKDVDDFKSMYKADIQIIDVIEVDMPFNSIEKRTEYHLIGKNV